MLEDQMKQPLKYSNDGMPELPVTQAVDAIELIRSNAKILRTHLQNWALSDARRGQVDTVTKKLATMVDTLDQLLRCV